MLMGLHSQMFPSHQFLVATREQLKDEGFDANAGRTTLVRQGFDSPAGKPARLRLAVPRRAVLLRCPAANAGGTTDS